jgi:hypothetical protein
MAATAVVTTSSVFGDRQVRFATVTLDASYPTGGEDVAAPLFNLSQINEVVIHSTSVATKRAVWDRATSKIKLFVEDAVTGIEAEAANASNQSAVTVQVMVVGK